MSYTPRLNELMGYIQATAINTQSISDLSFDIPNDMETTENATRTECRLDSLIIIRPSRDNDGTATRASSYWPTTDTTADAAYRGKVGSEVTYYNQCGPDAYWYGDHIDITQGSSLGSGGISYTDYSHAQLWRTS